MLSQQSCSPFILTLPLPSLVLALRSGGAGAAGGAAGVGAAAGAGAGAGEAAAPVSAPPSVPATTMFSTAAATLAAASAALAVAQPYKGTQHRVRNSALYCQTRKRTEIVNDKSYLLESKLQICLKITTPLEDCWC